MPLTEITRVETAERARLLSVDSYEVFLDLTRGGEVFGSTSVVKFGCAVPGASSYADAFLTDAARDQDLARVVSEGRDVVERALRSRALPDLP